MDNVIQKLMALTQVGEDKSSAVKPTLKEIVDKGKHLPSYKDIQDAHQVFVDALDDNHPKAVEMLVAAERLKEMAQQLRLDRDATEELHHTIAVVCGCAHMLAEESSSGDPNDANEAMQKHFFNLLGYLTDLNKAHMKYVQMVSAVEATNRA